MKVYYFDPNNLDKIVDWYDIERHRTSIVLCEERYSE